MRKRLIQIVNLVLFNDDATGEYGITHRETSEGDIKFNAFWGKIGIFHDAWEHNHEYTHRYFKGNYAMNVGGEMAAMGKMWYYQDELGLGEARALNPNSYYSPGENMRLTTQGEIQEAICNGYCNYGQTLESKVPKQKPVNNSELEYQVEKMWDEIRGYKFSRNSTYDETQEMEDSKRYKESCSPRKIADLHRWGYRQGEKLVPNTWENRKMLHEFMEFWEKFCKNNSAEDLYNWGYGGIEFRIYKQRDGVSWKAKLISRDYMIPDIQIKHPHQIEIYEPYE